jgi:hypothetical protein
VSETEQNGQRKIPTVADAKNRAVVATPSGVTGRLIGVKRGTGRAKVMIGNRHFVFKIVELTVVETPT